MKKLLISVAGIVVLGSAVFVHLAGAGESTFLQNLSYGMTNSTDVKALQQFLTTEGYYTGPITGNFYGLTLQGLKSFQAANQIQPVSGYFGPLSRTAANAVISSELSIYTQATGVEVPGVSVTSVPATALSPTKTQAAQTTSPDTLTLLEARVGNIFEKFWQLYGHGNTSASTGASSGSTNGSTSGTTVVTTTNTPASTPVVSTPVTPTPAPALSILPSSLPNGVVGTNYSQTVNVQTSAAGPYTWAVSAGSLPRNLSLNILSGGAEATISGNPTRVGTYTFSLNATNGTSSSTQSYTITINQAPVTTQTTTTTVTPTTTTNPTPTTTPIVSLPTGGMMWGAYVGDIDSNPSLVASFDSMAGANSNIIATFADLSSGDFPSGEKAVVGDKGKTLLLFLEPQYSFDQLNSGAYDSILQQYATAAQAYGDPIILAPFDEFNLNENQWGYGVGGNTPAKFIQAWQHVHSFFTGDSNVKFALVYNNVSEPQTSDNSYQAYYPGSAYVDYVAVDGFNFGTTNASAQTFSQIFDPIMPTLESFGKPILFSSIGSLEYPGKAQWLTTGLTSYIEQYPNVVGWVYFDYNDTAAGQNWTIGTDSSALAAFKAAILNL